MHTCASMPRALAQAASHGWHVIGAALICREATSICAESWTGMLSDCATYMRSGTGGRRSGQFAAC